MGTETKAKKKENEFPYIGQGAYQAFYSDREPYTVIGVPSPKTVILQRDDYERVDDNGFSDQQKYVFSRNPKGEIVIATLRSNGEWIPRGVPTRGAVSKFYIGKRVAYYDFSF